MLKTQYPNVNALLNKFTGMLQEALGSNLKGLYLFGSLVGGDFDEKTSDIDLLVIVKNVISESQLADLKNVHQALVDKYPEWDNRIEASYVSVDGMKNFKTQRSTIARISPGEPLHYRDMDIEWLMDWHMVQEQGLTILGPAPDTYIPHITNAEFIKSIRNILPMFEQSAKHARHKGFQSYIVMSFCRNLYAIKNGKQISKFAGASWAADHYPQWSEFIQKATEWHGMADKSDSLETQKQTIEFSKFAMYEAAKLTVKE